MSALHNYSPPGRQSALGFTLIELLIVIVIVSVLAGLTVISIAPGSPQRTLKREAQRLEATLLTAAESALLDGLEYGLRVTGKAYQIVKFDPRTEQWIQQETPAARGGGVDAGN